MLRYILILMLFFVQPAMAGPYPDVDDPELEARLREVISPEEIQRRRALVEIEMQSITTTIGLLKTDAEKAYAAVALNYLATGESINALLDSDGLKEGRTDATLEIRQKLKELHSMMGEYFGEYMQIVAAHYAEKNKQPPAPQKAP